MKGKMFSFEPAYLSCCCRCVCANKQSVFGAIVGGEATTIPAARGLLVSIDVAAAIKTTVKLIIESDLCRKESKLSPAKTKFFIKGQTIILITSKRKKNHVFKH